MDRFDASSSSVTTAEEIIAEARAGRMFLLVDDENRENEGDIVIPAQFADADKINFMARHGRGLICLALTRERAEWLGLAPMSATNSSRQSTAFTVSIEARTGIETGISAHDRARTIAVAIALETSRYDIVSPGHIFPVVSKDGGTLVRAGHTEAAVDVARLAGLSPFGVICEVMKDDGTMARLPDLIEFSRLHRLKLGTIADLIAFRRRSERLVELIQSGSVLDGEGRAWELSVFRDLTNGIEHLALAKGDLNAPGPVLVRIQAEDVVEHVLSTKRARNLHTAMDQIATAGRGVVVLIRGAKPILPVAKRILARPLLRFSRTTVLAHRFWSRLALAIFNYFRQCHVPLWAWKASDFELWSTSRSVRRAAFSGQSFQPSLSDSIIHKGNLI
jgi:3,4-dihydroxy 2-butanone 4-phosphate synthase / GTP cyclohydrolase II